MHVDWRRIQDPCDHRTKEAARRQIMGSAVPENSNFRQSVDFIGDDVVGDRSWNGFGVVFGTGFENARHRRFYLRLRQGFAICILHQDKAGGVTRVIFAAQLGKQIK